VKSSTISVFRLRLRKSKYFRCFSRCRRSWGASHLRKIGIFLLGSMRFSVRVLRVSATTFFRVSTAAWASGKTNSRVKAGNGVWTRNYWSPLIIW
jgi:hypothetical protein